MLKPLIIACAACLTTACTALPTTGYGPDIAQLQSADESPQAQREPTYRCVRATGTRIVREDRCLPSQGRVYTPAEIGSTGALSTGEALRRLDPSFR